MFAIGDRVIHPGQGLCTVVGFKDQPMPVIVLEAGSGRQVTRVMCPVDSAEKSLHPPVDKTQALAVIQNYASIECDPHTEHNSGQEEAYFKGLLKRGVPYSVMVAKTMRARIASAEAHGRKPSAYFARVLKEAERRSLEELACALDSTPDAVASMFEQSDMSA